MPKLQCTQCNRFLHAKAKNFPKSIVAVNKRTGEEVKTVGHVCKLCVQGR